MDTITQAALGAAMGEAVLGKRLGNRGLAWGALFGILPDLDIILHPLLKTAHELWWHRGPSHSLLVMVAMSFLLARPLSKLWKREKITPARAGTFVFLAWSTHVLIDCFNAYGTSVLWPFMERRVSFNHLFVIDPLLTLPLLVCLAWLVFLRKPKQRPKRLRLLAWGLGLAGGYVLLTVGLKFRVSSGFDADLTRRGVTYERRMEAPSPFNTLLWRSVVDRGDELWVGHRTVFEGKSKPVRWTVYRRGTADAAGFAEAREVRRVQWFSDGYWIARRHKRGLWIADLRFGELREMDARREDTVNHRMIFAWNYEPEAPVDKLIRDRPPKPDVKQALGQIAGRIVGKGGETWTAAPRLADVPGSFPEALDVIE
jgi:inner membrane protein